MIRQNYNRAIQNEKLAIRADLHQLEHDAQALADMNSEQPDNHYSGPALYTIVGKSIQPKSEYVIGAVRDDGKLVYPFRATKGQLESGYTYRNSRWYQTRFLSSDARRLMDNLVLPKGKYLMRIA